MTAATVPVPHDVASPFGGIVRGARRPEGWIAPGPAPQPPDHRDELWPRPGEDLCWLAGNWRILQRTDGHRFSLDDLATAHYAVTTWASTAARPVARALDLGCGIGTVLLLVAWSFPSAHVVGVEAQPISASMARRSVAWNGVSDRCEVRDGDLRDATVLGAEPRFDLITGTPPYFPRGTGVESDHVQRGPCRFEHRGGIEAYCAAAARALADDGLFVACAPSSQRDRALAAARAAELVVLRSRDVVPREGKQPLFTLYAMARDTARSCTAFNPLAEAPLVVRGSDGHRTADFQRLRALMGMPEAR